MTPTAVIRGVWVRLETIDDGNREELDELDWKRSRVPEMGGWFSRPEAGAAWGTMLFRSLASGTALGVLDAAPLPGYPGVVNLSIFTDTEVSPAGTAIEAYALYVTRLFEVGVRLVHQEVLEINSSVRRIFKRAGVPSTARLRQHGYAAGRRWDVLIYSYDATHFGRILDTFSQSQRGRALDPAGD